MYFILSYDPHVKSPDNQKVIDLSFKQILDMFKLRYVQPMPNMLFVKCEKESDRQSVHQHVMNYYNQTNAFTFLITPLINQGLVKGVTKTTFVDALKEITEPSQIFNII